MNNIFDEDVRTVTVACASCGEPIEIATSALSLFESRDSVLCMECLLQQGDTPSATPLRIEERIALIEDVVDDFATRLRSILVRSVRPDLSWNNSFGFEEWSDPADSIVAAHAPGIWYAGKGPAEARRRNTLP